MSLRILLILILLVTGYCADAQEENRSTLDKITSFPTRFLDKINKKSESIEDKLISGSVKGLEGKLDQAN